jgi:hypothetical protein
VPTSNVRRGQLSAKIGALTLVLASAVVTAACGSAPPPPGELGQNQRVLSSCPKNTKLATAIRIDASPSSLGDALEQARLDVVSDAARRTAICGGHLRVDVFSGSSTATATLYDGELALAGATDNARLRRAPDLVKDITTKVSDAYGPAAANLASNGSDILGQYRLGAEYLQQLGAGYQLNLVLLTDGFQNVGIDLTSAPLTRPQADALVAGVGVPSLPMANVTVAGLGKVGGEPPSTAIVNGLVNFYDAVCAKTAAAQCLSVTDYTIQDR